MDLQFIRLITGLIVLLLGLILVYANPNFYISGFLLFVIGLIIMMFGPIVYEPLFGLAKYGSKKKSFVMTLSIIIALLLMLVFVGIETKNPIITNVLLMLFPDLNLYNSTDFNRWLN